MQTITQLPTEMNAALYYEPGVVRYEETQVPTLADGEMLVKVQAALTCGTDLKCYRRGHPVLLKSFPSPFGHEFAGVVAAVADDVTRFDVGDRVVAANSAPCYNCHFCAKGHHNLCEQLDLLNGAYADYLKIPSRIVSYNTYKLPDDVPFEIAAFTEPLAVSLRGIEMSGVSPGDRVAIIGLGAIGQLLVKVAKWKGAHVTALGRSPLKLETAKRYGMADGVINMREISDPTTIKKHYTPQGYGFDVVIEAVGQPSTWEAAMDMVRRGGRVNLFGGCPGGTTVPLDTRRIHYDEITLLSLFHHTPFYFKKALDLLINRDIDPAPLISETLPMSRFEEALVKVEKAEAIKVALSNGMAD